MTDVDIARIRAAAENLAHLRERISFTLPPSGEAASRFLQTCLATTPEADVLALLAEVERLNELLRLEVQYRESITKHNPPIGSA